MPLAWRSLQCYKAPIYASNHLARIHLSLGAYAQVRFTSRRRVGAKAQFPGYTLEPMRKLPNFLISIPVWITAFALGAMIAIVNHWGQPLVSIRVENASGQEFRFLVISYTGNGFKGQVEAVPPKPGTSTTVRFYHQGEGGCQVAVTLADGKVLQGIGGYIEPGYSLSFKVAPNDIAGGLSSLK